MVNVTFTKGMERAVVPKGCLTMYDKGRTLRIYGLDLPPVCSIDFSFGEKHGLSIPQDAFTVDGVTTVKIPDRIFNPEYFTEDYVAFAYIYILDKTVGMTVKSIMLNIEARPKPEGYDFEIDVPDFQETIQKVSEISEVTIAARDKTLEYMNDAGEDAERAEAAADRAEIASDKAEEYRNESFASAVLAEGYKDEAKIFADSAIASAASADETKEAVEEMVEEVINARNDTYIFRDDAQSSAESAELSKTQAKTYRDETEVFRNEVASDKVVIDENREVVETLAAETKAARDEAVVLVDNAETVFDFKKEEALTQIETAKTEAVDEINDQEEEALNDISDTKTSAVNAVELKKQESLQVLDDMKHIVVVDSPEEVTDQTKIVFETNKEPVIIEFPDGDTVEKKQNKVTSITEDNKNSTEKYTSIKAVNDYVEPLKADLVELDSRLSESIVEISEAFDYDEISEGSKNFLKPNSEKGYWDTTTGEPVASASYNRTPDFVPAETSARGRTVYIYAKDGNFFGGRVMVIEYAEDNTIIKTYYNGTDGGNITLYPNCTKIKVWTNKADFVIGNICLMYDEPSGYEEYREGKEEKTNYRVKFEKLPANVQKSSNVVENISIVPSDFESGYIGQSGNIISDSGFLHSDLIPVYPSTKIIVENYAGTASCGIHYYSSTGVYIGHTSASSGSSISKTEYDVPNDVRFIRYSIKTSQVSTNKCYYAEMYSKSEISDYAFDKWSDIKPNIFTPLSKIVPVCTFIDDDAISVDATKAFYDACIAKDIVGTYASVTKYLDSQIGLEEQLLSYESEGFEITLHAENHDQAFQRGRNRTKADEKIIEAEVPRALRRLRNAGFNPENLLYWVTPYGVHDAFIQKVAIRNGLRCIVSAANKEVEYGKYGKYSMQRPEILNDGKETVASLKAYIDEAIENNGWIIFCSHFGYPDWESSGSLAMWNEIVDYAKTRGITITTYAEGFRMRQPIYDMFDAM